MENNHIINIGQSNNNLLKPCESFQNSFLLYGKINNFHVNSNIDIETNHEIEGLKEKNQEIENQIRNLDLQVTLREFRYLILEAIVYRFKSNHELIVNSDSCTFQKFKDEKFLDIPDDYYTSKLLYKFRKSSTIRKNELELEVSTEILRLIDPNGFESIFSSTLTAATVEAYSKEDLDDNLKLNSCPLPYITRILGIDLLAEETNISEVLSASEYSNGVNLANIASTPGIITRFLNKYQVLWPKTEEVSLNYQEKVNEFKLKDNNQVIKEPIPENTKKLTSSIEYLIDEDNSSFSLTCDNEINYDHHNHSPLSLGSMTHFLGLCKPCVFVNKANKTCRNGKVCSFCHYQHKERKRGKRYKNFALNCRNDVTQNIEGAHKVNRNTKHNLNIDIKKKIIDENNNGIVKINYTLPPPPPPPSISGNLDTISNLKNMSLNKFVNKQGNYDNHVFAPSYWDLNQSLWNDNSNFNQKYSTSNDEIGDWYTAFQSLMSSNNTPDLANINNCLPNYFKNQNNDDTLYSQLGFNIKDEIDDKLFYSWK